MGKRGPAPKPSELRIADGTFRKDRHDGIRPGGGAPEKPEWLEGDAVDIWQEVIELLGRTPGLLSAVDGFALSRYCQDWVEYHTLQKLVDVEGYSVMSEKGNLYQNPAVGIRNKAADRMARFEAKYGMTPSDRVGLNITQVKQGVRRRTV